MALLSEYIIPNASEFKENPVCKLFYISTGTYSETDSNLEGVRQSSIEKLKTIQRNCFSSPRC